MKKILLIILGIVLVVGCTKDDKGEVGNIPPETITLVPAPPTNLNGLVASTSQINLMWTDRSTNENGFKIERKLVGGTFAVVGTTAKDIATFNNTGLTPAKTYIYRVYSYNSSGNSINNSNELSLTTTALFPTVNVPTVSTTNTSAITPTSATCGGTITADGGATIIARGVCWSNTTSIPTIANSKTVDGTGISSFTSSLTGLSPGTTYYVRAYATNSAGTGYGTQESFTTATLLIPTITNGTQFWQNTNLNVSTYSDGTVIPQVTDPTQWANLTTGAWCYHGNTTANGTTYGKLYNWYAVAGIWNEASKTNASQRKKLAPSGYHVPSDAEWTTLITYLGGVGIAGGKMKSTGTTLWTSPNTGATNSSGFTGLPGGYRFSNGSFGYYVGLFGTWWSSSESSTTNAWSRLLYYNYGSIGSNMDNKASGFSVRCLRD